MVFAEGTETRGAAEGGVQEAGAPHFPPRFSVFPTQIGAARRRTKHKQANETPFDSALAQLMTPD